MRSLSRTLLLLLVAILSCNVVIGTQSKRVARKTVRSGALKYRELGYSMSYVYFGPKSHKSAKKSKKSSSSKKSSKSCKSSKSKSSKSNSKKYECDEHDRTDSPAPPPTAPTPAMPSATGSPTPVPTPVSTPPPTGETAEPTAAPAAVEYTLLYDISQSRLPVVSEFEALLILTDDYLDGFLGATFGSTFRGSTTSITGTAFNFGQPLEIDYETTFTFAPPSSTPSESELRNAVFSAFSGANAANYLNLVQALNTPPGNLFNTATSIDLQGANGSVPIPQSTTSSSRPMVLAAALAGAGAFVFLVAGAVMLRNRDGTEDDAQVKKHGSHITVADETYAGSTSTTSNPNAPALTRYRSNPPCDAPAVEEHEEIEEASLAVVAL